MDKKEIWRAIKFVLFSASAGMIEIALFTLLNELTGWPYWPCYLLALIASVLWNFTLNREFTFKSAGNVPRAMALVALFHDVAMIYFLYVIFRWPIDSNFIAVVLMILVTR